MNADYAAYKLGVATGTHDPPPGTGQHGGGSEAAGSAAALSTLRATCLVRSCVLSQRGQRGRGIRPVSSLHACMLTVPSSQHRKKFLLSRRCKNLCCGKDLYRAANQGAGARWQAIDKSRCAARQTRTGHFIPADLQTHARARTLLSGC